jgi:hypothetical protein
MAKDIEVEIFLKGGKTFVRDVKKTGDAAEDAAGGFSKAQANIISLDAGMRLLSTTARTAARAIGVLVDIGVAATQAGSDFEEASQKFGVVFGQVAGESRVLRDELARNFGLSTLAATELLSATGDLLTGFGLTDRAALDLSNELNQLAVDLASFSNVEGGAARTSEILTKALLGERESLKSLGISILEADVKGRLLEKGQDQLAGSALRAARAQATFELILEQSTKAQGDFARSSGSLANQQRILNARFEDLQTQLGQELVPIVGVFTAELVEAVDAATEWAEANKEIVTSELITFAKGVAAAFTFIADATLFVAKGFNGLVGAGEIVGQVFLDLQAVSLRAYAAIVEGVADLARALVRGFNDPLNTIKTLFFEFAREVTEFILDSDIAKAILPEAAIAKLNNNLKIIEENIKASTTVETGDNAFSDFLNETSQSLLEGADTAEEYANGLQQAQIETANNIAAIDSLRGSIKSLNSDIQDGLNKIEQQSSGSVRLEQQAGQQAALLEAERAALEEKERLAREELELKKQAAVAFNEFFAQSQDQQIAAVEEATQLRLQGLEEAAREDVEIYQQYSDLRKDIEEQEAAEIFAIREAFRGKDKTARDQAAKDRQIAQARENSQLISAQGQLLGGLSELVATTGAENFRTTKALRIGEAIMNTYAGANQAYAQGGAYGYVLAAAIIAAGLANVNKIRQQKPPQRAQNGIDLVQRAEQPALLHLGETVLTRDETSLLSDFLKDVNTGNAGEGSTMGGGVTVNLNFEQFTLMSDDDEAIGNLTNAIQRKLEEQNFVGATA